MPPQVSVIIPVYNGSLYLEEAIASVMAQTYSDWELLLVDDGSTDDSASIAQKFCRQEGDRIRYLRQPNQGVSVARNTGVQAAQGEYLAFLDQDDWFLPEKLMLQVAQLQAQHHLAMISSGWRIVDGQSRGETAVQPWEGLPVLSLEAWVRWKPVFLGAMMFRRSWVERSPGFNAQLQQTGDVAIVLQIAKMGGQADWTKQVTVGYRQHSQNVSRDALQQAQELEIVLDQLFADAPIALQRLENSSRYQSLVWSAWRLQHNGCLGEMAEYLERSLPYADRPTTATILDWLEQFQAYAAEYGEEVEIDRVTRSPEWQQLMQTCISNRKLYLPQSC